MASLAQFLALAATAALGAGVGPAQATTFIDFRSVDGKLLADNETFHIKGMNWFGGETIELVVQGLWPSATTIGDALDIMADYNFNALRLPLAMDSVIEDPTVPSSQTAGSPELSGLSYLQVLDEIVEQCRQRSILVMFDSHRIEASEPDFPDLGVPADITPALEKLATRYCNDPSTWNVFAIDIKNEPKGDATWGMGDESSDWDLAAAEIGNAILDKCDRLLIFVEGVQTEIKGEDLEWGQAGGSLQGAKNYPVELSNMERLVYSPHLISPGVDYKAPWWSASDFPENMASIWDDYFGFVPKETGQALVVGSWGAKLEKTNKEWANAVAAYLEDNTIGSFYWAFNPQSADTGGFIDDDWSTPMDDRVELLDTLPASSVKKIVEKYAVCEDSCDGNGSCEDSVCQCYDGWSGPQCSICSEGDTAACNLMGTCLRNSTCECDEGADGEFCAGSNCDGVDCGGGSSAGCFNGQCTCLHNCVGNSCTVCAANDTALAAGVDGATILCDACEDASSATMPGPSMAVVAWACVLLAAVSFA